MLVDMCRKLFEAKEQVVTVTQEGVVTYKATKKCHNDQMQYTTMTYLVSKNVVQSKVAIHFLGLNLPFVNVELEKSDDDSTPRLKDAIGPSSDGDPPPIA